ncbi:copia protein, partial [Tanacetum coccineum]
WIQKRKHDIILVQVYVDDIIFGSIKKSWCDEFEALMKSRFQMSSMGELTFFLGLQVKQKLDGIFISQDKYVAEILKKFDFASVKTASTPIETQKPLVKDEEASDVDVHLYRSMIGSLMYVTASLQAIISLTDDLSLLSKMAALESCPKHNMIAYLEKTEGNVEFHEVIDFLQRSYIFHALTVTSIRTDLIFDDADGIDSLPNQAIFNAIQLMGYEGDLTVLTFNKALFSPQWRSSQGNTSLEGRKFAKGESSVQRDPLFDEMPEDTVDHMDTENAQDEGRTREVVDEDKEIEENALSTKEVLSTDREGVSTDIEKVSTDKPIVSTNGFKVSTDKHNEGTEEKNEGTKEIFEGAGEHIEGTKEHIEGTEEQVKSTDGYKKGTEEEITPQATQTSTQTPTSMIFGDDETIAKVLLNMSHTKVVSKEKEKGVELKDVEETDRPMPTSTRSLLTLKPLPKIDPRAKGKKKIEEEDESESEADGIPQAEKKFKQLESDEELARKVQEEWEAEEERNRIAEENATNEDLIRDFDDIKARIEAYRLLAEKLQEKEREQFTIEERAKFLAQQRSEAIRNKPPTKN